MSFESTSTLQQPDGVSAAAAASSGSLGGGGGGGTGIEVIQLDASGGNVTETLPTPTGGATALALRVDTSTSNTATLDTPGSQEIRFAEGKNVSSTTLGVEQSLLLSSDGNNWYVEEGQGLSAEAEAVTTDAATKDSPSLTQTATYDSDGTTSVTSSDVSIERYVRTDNNGNATLVYESGGTEIARLSSGGRFETRKDQEAFMDGSLSSGQGTNSLLQFEDANNNRSTTDLAKLTVKGSGVTVTNPSTDEYVLDITGGGSGSATDILDNGTEVVADATDINFGGGDFDVSQNANNASRTDVTLTNDSVTVAGNNVSLGGSTGIGHSDLSGISSDDHHSKYTDSDAVTAVGASTPFANSDLSNSSVTVAGNVVNLGNSTAINHGDLSSIGSDDHHPKTTSASDLTDVSPDSDADAHHAVFEPADYNPVSDVETHGNALAIDITGDADTLDGVEGSNYARSNIDDTIQAQYTFEQSPIIDDSTFPRISFRGGSTKDWKVQVSTGSVASGNLVFQYGIGSFSFVHTQSGNTGFGGETAPSYAVDVNGTAAANTIRLGDYTVTQDSSDGDLNFFHGGSKVLELTDGGVLRAAGDVVAFGLSGGGTAGSTSGLQADAPLTLDTTTDPDTISLSVGSGLTVTNGTLEADGSVGVSSVFGRTGDVTASSGDYSHGQISGISSDDHHTRYSDEEAQDAVGTILTDSGAASVTYDDAGNTITISATDTDTQLSDSEVQTAINNDSDHGSTASHNYTTSASRLSDVSPDSDPDAHHAVFEPSDYNPEADTHDRYADSEAVSAVNAESSLSVDIAGDADSVDGYQGSELAVLAEDETVTGGWKFNGGVRLVNSNETTHTIRVGQHGGASNKLRWVPFIDDGSKGFQFNQDFSFNFSSGSWFFDPNVGFGGVEAPSYAVDVNGTGNFSGDLYAAGSVGIGTTSPDSKLEVLGELTAKNPASSPTGSALSATSPGGNLGLVFIAGDGSGGVSNRWDFRATGNSFSLIDDSLNNTIFSADTSGNLGIGGINSPSYALEVIGDARATGEVEAFLGSDRRLKTALDPLDSALDKVGRLTGYGFDWRGGDAVQPHKRGETDVGLIAQEVEGVLPEAVKEFQDGHSEGYKSVSYDKLVPLLVEAIKDLRSQVNNLQ